MTRQSARILLLFPVRSLVCVVGLSLAATPDAFAQAITRVSVDGGGAQAAAGGDTPSITADGRYVAFASGASTLVPNDTNAASDVFVKDRQTGAIERVSVATGGAQGALDSLHPRITPDGRFVAFSSRSAFVADDTNDCAGPCSDIYLHDRTTGETTLISRATNGTLPNGHSTDPDISADGRYIVFLSVATNLAPGTDTATHVYLRDRVAGTTTWIDAPPGGAVSSFDPAVAPRISSDGSTIVFLSPSTHLDLTPDPLPREGLVTVAKRVFIVDRASGALSRLTLTDGFSTPPAGVDAVTIYAAEVSGDGRTVAFIMSTFGRDGNGGLTGSNLDLVSQRATGHTRLIDQHVLNPGGAPAHAAIDARGQVVAFCDLAQSAGPYTLRLTDLVTIGSLIPTPDSLATLSSCSSVTMTGDGNVVAFDTVSALVGNDTNNVPDVYVLNRDSDHDGIPDDWETMMGLNPNDASDATLDPDGDGVTNLREYVARTNPHGTFTRYLAEGAENSFFHTRITLYNPNDTPAVVLMRYLGDSGSVRNLSFTLPARMQLSPALSRDFNVPLPDASFSTVIESDRFVAAERTMSWGTTEIYGSHAETAVAAPSTTWFFAEGATHGNFDLFYLLQNPGDTAATVSIAYLLPAGQAPIVRPYTVAAHSRLTIWVDQEPGLGATDVSAKIVSDVPILAERSMYFSTPTQSFAGGTGGAGIPQAATQWFAPEGATGGFFDLFILIGNPSAQDAAVTVTYLLEDGTSFDKSYTVAAESRVTISVKSEDPRLAATSLSTRVTSTNGVPIVVERAMWWPSPNWYEGHLTAATTETGTAWVLADGTLAANFVGTTQTYLLIANPSDTPAHVTLDLTGLRYDIDQTEPIACTGAVDVKAHSRFTIDLEGFCQLTLGGLSNSLGGVIRSDGPAIVVERSTYTSTNTQFWASGSSTLLTRLPPP